jgi:predicted alpha/beta hydrolase family esterase
VSVDVSMKIVLLNTSRRLVAVAESWVARFMQRVLQGLRVTRWTDLVTKPLGCVALVSMFSRWRSCLISGSIFLQQPQRGCA